VAEERSSAIDYSASTVLAENKAGDVFWEGAVAHSVENIGGSGARAYMIELREPPIAANRK